MQNSKMSAGTNAEQSTKDETRLPSSPTCGNTHVVRSPLLSDYIHLYLGCEIQYEEKLVFGNTETRKGLSFGVDDRFVSFYPITKYNKLSESGVTIRKPIKDCKPILRSLNDATPDEIKEIEDSRVFVKATPVHHVGNMQWTPETFRLVLSKHFDLFGLIKNGLALDATKLNAVPER